MRKNLRGFPSHLQKLVDVLVREEFAELAPVSIEPFVRTELKGESVAHWSELIINGTGRRDRIICFNLEGKRQAFLSADDETLRRVIRHELIHGEMGRRGLPNGDNDLPFIVECLRRGVGVNSESFRVLEKADADGTLAEYLRAMDPEALKDFLSALKWTEKNERGLR
jgi:hypothetical protein